MHFVESVDYVNRRVHLAAATVGTDLDTLDIYREMREMRRTNEDHRKFKPMVISGGNVVKIPGVSYTLPYVQLLYGCRLVPYDASHTLRLIRDTFTDDGSAGRDCFDRSSLSASVEVDIDVDIEKIEVRVVSTGGSAVLPSDITAIAAANATAMLASLYEDAQTFRDYLRLTRAVLLAKDRGTPTNPKYESADGSKVRVEGIITDGVRSSVPVLDPD